MDLDEFKKQMIRDRLEIGKEYGRIFSFIDFANVNHWFEHDEQDWNSQLIPHDKKMEINLEELKSFSDFFSQKVQIYYGEDSHNNSSLGFTYKLRLIFGKRHVVTKDLQRIKHYLDSGESTRGFAEHDADGRMFVEIRKCNFDIEIAVDAFKMIEHFDTFCLFSGDSDFVYLNNFLRKKGKKIIIIKGGYITSKLRASANLVINAQTIKKEITRVIDAKTKT